MKLTEINGPTGQQPIELLLYSGKDQNPGNFSKLREAIPLITFLRISEVLFAELQIMSTQSKYGWAIGLIVAGVIAALPFSRSSNPNSEIAQNTLKQSAGETSSEEQEAASQLLPEIPADTGEERNSSLNESSSPSEISGNIPGRLVEPPVDTEEIVRADQPKSLQPVDFSNQRPEDDRFRMKPVNTNRFQSASQRRQPVFSNASRSRQVIHYRLRDGDTLRSIANRYLGDSERYDEILADNRHILTNGENFLPIGQYITIVSQ